MLFGPILGLNHQSVRATATAIVGNGNATDCLRPIAFADDWEDNRDDPPAGVEFRATLSLVRARRSQTRRLYCAKRYAVRPHDDFGRSRRADHLGPRPGHDLYRYADYS